MILLSLIALKNNNILFIGIEILIFISIILSVKIYKSFIQPLNLISTGIESIKDKDFNIKFLNVGQKEMDGLIEVYNKMIEQLREERVKIKEQHYFLNKLIEASPSGIIILDFENRISHINPVAQSIINLDDSDIIGKTLVNIPGSFAKEISKINENESIIINIDGLHSYKCQKAHFRDRGFQHYFILIEELSDEIIKTEKRAYGKVIRMMSHEISNTIGAINSILNTSLNYGDQLSPNDRDEYVNALQIAIDRNHRLNQFMTNFSDVVRIPPPALESYSLVKLIEDVKVLMSSECQKNNIEIQIESADDDFIVEIDVRQMELVLVNAVKNSIEAIGKDGSIILYIDNKPFKSLKIRDNGCGVLDDKRKEIFTPFYSTKKNGQGIGLTVIREILMNHGFDFSLETNSDGFTDFKIRFDKHKK